MHSGPSGCLRLVQRDFPAAHNTIGKNTVAAARFQLPYRCRRVCKIMGVTLVDNRVKVVAELKRQVAGRLNTAAQFFVGEAQRNANIDTGFMKEHIGMTLAATAERLEAEVRSLAPYSGPQDTGLRGNLFWTRAYIRTREMFKQFLYGTAGSAGSGVIRAAQEDFHGPMGRKGGGF